MVVLLPGQPCHLEPEKNFFLSKNISKEAYHILYNIIFHLVTNTEPPSPTSFPPPLSLHQVEKFLYLHFVHDEVCT